MLDAQRVTMAVGGLCEGHELSTEEREAGLAALQGRVMTGDGERLLYVQVFTIALRNTDVDESIWTTEDDLADDDRCFAEQLFPLPALLHDHTRYARYERRTFETCDEERIASWHALQRRVVMPLRRVIGR